MARVWAVEGSHRTHLREQAAELRDRPVDGLKHSPRARAGRRRRDDAFNVEADVTKARQGPRGVNGTRVWPFSFLSPCLPYPRGGNLAVLIHYAGALRLRGGVLSGRDFPTQGPS
eukprot:scaffold83239_cov18-Phaeocystis_antarctica.AAC.1